MTIGKTGEKSLLPESVPSVGLTTDQSRIILRDKIITNLKSIAKKYDDEVNAQANAYAEKVTKGSFDSDEDLYQAAKESLDETYGQKKQKATERMQTSSDELSDKRLSLESDRTRALSRLAKQYDQKQDRLVEKLTKRGLASSSIATLAREEAATERAQAEAETDALYNKRIQTVDRKIEALTASYNAALKNFEVSYAMDLQDKIDRLKGKRDKLQSDYEKTRASDKKQAYNAYIEQQEQTNREYEQKEGDYSGAKKQNYEERYTYLLEELQGKNKKSVQKFILENDALLRSYLGLYYDRFVKEVT